jgi:histone H3/H4
MTDLIVKTNVQEALDDHQVSAELFEALDSEVEDILEEAAQRAEANDRRTVMPYDL